MKPSELNVQERESLQKLVLEHENNQEFGSALDLQVQVIQMIERDPRCTSHELGDNFFRLGYLAYQLGNSEAAVKNLTKALGFRRLFYGKGHEKVIETMDLIKEIRAKAKKSAEKIDRRTAEYKRSKAAKHAPQ